MQRTRVTLWLEPLELTLLMQVKGSSKPGAAAHRILSEALGTRAESPSIPPVNLDAWRVLSRLAGTLELLAKKSLVTHVTKTETLEAVQKFREALICASGVSGEE